MTQFDAQFVGTIREATHADVADLERMHLALQAHFAEANQHLIPLSAQRMATLKDFYRHLIENPQARILMAMKRRKHGGLVWQ